MTDSIKSPLKFDGLNFNMIIFLQSLESQVAKAVTKLFCVPNGAENACTDVATKEFDTNTKVHYVLLKY